MTNWDDLNPLDWPGDSFLTLYVALAGITLGLLWLWSNRLGPDRPAADASGLSVLHFAYLAGGAARAMDTALVGLLEAGAAIPEPGRGVILVDRFTPVPEVFQPFRHVSLGETRRPAFRTEFSPRSARLRDELARRGLVPSDGEIARFRIRAAAILAVVVAFGLGKLALGLSRERPVGYLTVLLLVTIVLGIVLLARQPSRNRAGDALLSRVRHDQARALRAPLSEEIPLAFAFGGTAALAGRPYRVVLSQGGDSSSDSSSGDSGGGGDGGGGCGGCSA